MSSSTTFPLFDILYSESKDTDHLSKDESKELCEYIKKMDREGMELALAIIRYYSVVIENEKINEHPFQSKVNKNIYKFDMDIIPERLKMMLMIFVKRHIQKLLEEQERMTALDMISKS